MDAIKLNVSQVGDVQSGHPTLLLRLLGDFSFHAGSRPIEISRRGQQLMALLALRSSLDRSVVAGTIWEASSEDRALGCLRTELWRIHRQLPACVINDGRRLHLNGEVRVDVREFVTRGRRVLDPTQDLRLHDVPDPWECGDLLPGWEQVWLQSDRERLRQLRLHVCETAALRLSAVGQHSLALDLALGVVRIEPTRESAYRTLIAVHLAEGNLVEAQRAFNACAAMLRDELGCAPSFTLDVTAVAGLRRTAPVLGKRRSARLPART